MTSNNYIGPTAGPTRHAVGPHPSSQRTVNVLLVGVGPHAQRTYVPHLVKHADRHHARLAAVVELEGCQLQTEETLKKHAMDPERLYVDRFDRTVPDAVREQLDGVIERNRINAVIISTEPLVHKAYLDYALDSGLNVLIDKPLTTRRGVAHDVDQARGIWDDYADTLKRYRGPQSSGRQTCLLVNSHRRYHPGFQKVFELIAEVRNRTGCPVTSVTSEHCDGQWRLPAEIVSQDYHPYNQGYGKVSHSGYHLLDMVNCFFVAGQVAGKVPDTVSLTSSFLLPAGFLKQVSREDYVRYFGEQYDQACVADDDELRSQMEQFGEIDATALVEFRQHKVVVTQAKVSLQHNGFARRTWLQPGNDLYKGAGRVRHERHRIDNGPFQTVYIESYQAKDKHDMSDRMDFEMGGNNHFEILVFRNPGPHGSERPMEVIRLRDLRGAADFDTSMLYNEQVKEACLLEFLQFARGELPLSQLRSNIDSHALTVRMMSGIYQAHAERAAGGAGWVNVDL